MSIKTLRKRIALVAVSALGVGLLSVAPASAADTALYLGANSSLGATMSATKASNLSAGLISGDGDISATDTATMLSSGTLGLHSTAGDGISVLTVSGGRITAASGAATTTAITVNSAGTVAGSASGAVAQYQVVPNSGSTSITIKLYDAATAATASTGGTLVATLVVTVVDVAQVGKFSPSLSYGKVSSNSTNSAVTDSSESATARTVANGSAGYIVMTLKDETNTAMPSTTLVSATATGGAVVSLDGGSTYGTAASASYGSNGYFNVIVAQAVANTPVTAGVVTVSINGAVWLTRTIKIVGDVDKITLGDESRGARSANNADGFYLYVLDSAGNLISGKTPTATAGSTGEVVSAVTVAASDSYTLPTGQAFECSATRGKGNIQYSFVNTRGQTILSNVLPVVCAGGVYTYSASLDAASYAQGGVATLSITAKDSQGNPVNDYATIGAGQSISCGSQMTAVTAPSTADTFTNGVKKYTMTVGTTAGNYNCVVSLAAYNSTSTPQAAVTAAFTIKGDGSVSNAEVLAAIVKLIASINKQIAALQKSLKKK
jgi:hypothetical protein